MGLGATTLAIPQALLSRANVAKKPNIVLIMADDMGYSDIGCYGGEVHTPNIDRLAANGIRFTQFYNTARCCPTRASLMTGLYPHQVGMGWMTVRDLGTEGYRGDLNNRGVTIAEMLKQAGYGTYMSGKWHLTFDKYWNGPKHSWPRQRGFDRFYGTIAGAGSFYTPATLTRDNTRIEAPSEGYYYTDAISDNACTFISEHCQSKQDDPFFLYVAYTAPHWPLHAKPEDIAKYKGKYMKGWDTLRQERYTRMIEMGIIDKKWALTPREKNITPWEQVDKKRKEWMDLKMAIYAAQIDCMDQGIGRILSTLEKKGQLENTLIFFLSDNGGNAEVGPWGFDNKKDGVLGENSSFSSYGASWANASNTPFRRYKHWVHEGGIATPLIVHWPSRIKDHGQFRRQPGHVIDIMATCVDVAGATYPDSYKGVEILPPEGKSIVPAFDNKTIEREAIYWEHEANRAVRVGKWKLVSMYRSRDNLGPWELYDMENDRTETKDLASKYPDLVQKMSAMWLRYAERANVFPLDGRSWDERLKNPIQDLR
ncbi:MAG: arylsulfatase [Calditrichaeota bacterium]|nr:arylsulfatase [Calditrichota bacterium]